MRRSHIKYSTTSAMYGFKQKLNWFYLINGFGIADLENSIHPLPLKLYIKTILDMYDLFAL